MSHHRNHQAETTWQLGRIFRGPKSPPPVSATPAIAMLNFLPNHENDHLEPADMPGCYHPEPADMPGCYHTELADMPGCYHPEPADMPGCYHPEPADMPGCYHTELADMPGCYLFRERLSAHIK